MALQREDNVTTYLFITDPVKHPPESVEDGTDDQWSCSKTTSAGDIAYLYQTGGLGIGYQWRVVSDAQPDPDWVYQCGVEHVRKFTPPISLREIWDAIPREIWAAPYTHFRGMKSIRIPEEAVAILERLRPAKTTSRKPKQERRA
jgi:hypothetical protein